MTIIDSLVVFSGELTAAAILIATIVIAAFAVAFARHYVKASAAKTEKALADVVIKVTGRPLLLAILLSGAYLALEALPEAATYGKEIGLGFAVAGVLLGAFIIVRIVNAAIEWYALEVARKTKGTVDRHVLPMLKKVVYLIVYSIALAWILRLFGVEITAIVAALGVGGIAVALALQSTLTNLFAGAYIAVDRPVKIGDYIETDTGHSGYVDDIGWRSTRLRTQLTGKLNNYIVLPNSKLAESVVTNYYTPKKEISVALNCGVAYGSDLEKVEEVTLRAAKKVQQAVAGASRNIEPSMRYNEFGDSNINFSISIGVQEYTERYAVIHELIKALKKEYDREGIEISFPTRSIYIRNDSPRLHN